MFRTIAVGCSKMDSKVLAPPIAEIEELAAWAFRKADRDNDGEISRAEFDAAMVELAGVEKVERAVRHVRELSDAPTLLRETSV